jgi:hypothetical protein
MSDDRHDPVRTLRTRGPELGVAALLLVIAGLVIADSLRVGIGWADDGPRSGYFPFYIGLLLAASSGWVLVAQLLRWRSDRQEFATRAQIGLVVSVLVPMVVYVGLIGLLGIYVASALLIGYFMLRHGKYKAKLALPVALGVPLFFFAVFEKWFLVPLPKGPFETWLGL